MSSTEDRQPWLVEGNWNQTEGGEISMDRLLIKQGIRPEDARRINRLFRNVTFERRQVEGKEGFHHNISYQHNNELIYAENYNFLIPKTVVNASGQSYKTIWWRDVGTNRVTTSNRILKQRLSHQRDANGADIMRHNTPTYITWEVSECGNKMTELTQVGEESGERYYVKVNETS